MQNLLYIEGLFTFFLNLISQLIPRSGEAYYIGTSIMGIFALYRDYEIILKSRLLTLIIPGGGGGGGGGPVYILS